MTISVIVLGSPRNPATFVTIALPVLCGMLLLAFLTSRYRRASNLERTAYVTLLVCGLANTIDQALRGYVLDTLQVAWLGSYIPFNLADFGITAGAVVAIGCLAREAVISFQTKAQVETLA